jgi:hypothetical protein
MSSNNIEGGLKREDGKRDEERKKKAKIGSCGVKVFNRNSNSDLYHTTKKVR